MLRTVLHSMVGAAERRGSSTTLTITLPALNLELAGLEKAKEM